MVSTLSATSMQGPTQHCNCTVRNLHTVSGPPQNAVMCLQQVLGGNAFSPEQVAAAEKQFEERLVRL